MRPVTRIAAITAVLMLTTAAVADASWLTSRTIVRSKTAQVFFTGPDTLVVDSSRRALLTWARQPGGRHPTMVATRRAGRGWRKRKPLAVTGLRLVRGEGHTVIAAGDGTTTGAMSKRPVTLLGTTRGSFGRPRLLDPRFRPRARTYSTLLDLAGSSTGHAIAVVGRSGSGPSFSTDLLAVTRRPGRSFGRPVRITSDSDAVSVAAAVNARGEMLVAWGDSIYNEDIHVRMRARDGRWGPTQAIRRAKRGNFGNVLDAALGPRGQALVAWASSYAGADDYAPGPVQASLKPRGRPFSPAFSLGTAAAGSGDEVAPVFTTYASDGRAVMAWTDSRRRGNVRALAATIEGESVRRTALSNPRYQGAVHGLAAGPGGAAVVTWATMTHPGGGYIDFLPRRLLAAKRVGPRFKSLGEITREGLGEVVSSAVAIDPTSRTPLTVWSNVSGREAPRPRYALRFSVGPPLR